MKPLLRRFYDRDAETVAKELLGKILIRQVGSQKLIARIIETEAYVGPDDLASHSHFGKTKRNAVMFGSAGHAYIYLVYGTYYCLNIVTGKKDFGAAVLIRAVEPKENISGKTNGPGLLCRTLGIDQKLNGLDVTKIGLLYVIDSKENVPIVKTTRIGVEYAREWKDKPLRFFIKDNKFVSR